MSLPFLIEMGWKSLVISGLALILGAMLRSRSAADRAAVLRLSIVLLLGLPVVATTLPRLTVHEPPPAILEPFVPASAIAIPAIDGASADPVIAALPAEAPRRAFPPIQAMIPALYLLGVLLFATKLAVGVWTLARWTARAEPVTDAAWMSALGRQSGRVRLLASDRIRSPLSWGLVRPAVLIDHNSLRRPEDAHAIVAHELAHIARRDWLTLVLARLTVAIFWFNPAVWLVERALLDQAEEAADLEALRRVEPVSYAQTLLGCVRDATTPAVPANAIASTSLKRRVGAILDPKRRRVRPGSLWTTTAMLGAVGLAWPVAALELAPASSPAPISAEPVAPPQSPSGKAAVERAEGARRQAERANLADAAGHAWREARHDPEPAEAVADEERRLSDEQLREAERAAAARVRQATRLAREALERKRDQMIEREREAARREVERGQRAREMSEREAALAAERSAREGARLGAQVGATIEEAMAQAFGPKLQKSKYDAALAAVGVDDRMIEGLASVGYRDLTRDELIRMAVFRVTPTYIRELAAVGYRDLTPGQLYTFRVHKVTPDYVRELTEAAGEKLTPEQIVRMRILGASGDDLRRAKAGDPKADILVGKALRRST